jgi:probable F420-dependent oxidoreductase
MEAVGRTLAPVKVRIGIGLATGAFDAAGFTHVVDECERLRFDSLWATERVNASTLDPIVAMTYAVARTTRMKVGTSVMVLPGRNPVLLAKALATLDHLSAGRVLPALGLGAVNAAEHQAFGVARNERSAIFDEALPLMRRLWSEDEVTHHGRFFDLEGVTVLPKPARKNLDVWLGGASKRELERCGRLGDGWLPSFCTVDSVRTGIDVVNEAAAAAGRAIDPEHFGVLLPYLDGPIPEPLVQVVRTRNPDADPRDVIASNREELAERVARFVEVGASKFVVFPYGEVRDWSDELAALASELLPLET